jgi:hypothetical protein
LPLPVDVEEAVLAVAKLSFENERDGQRNINWFEVDGTYYTFVPTGNSGTDSRSWEEAERYCRLHVSASLGAGGSGGRTTL